MYKTKNNLPLDCLYPLCLLVPAFATDQINVPEQGLTLTKEYGDFNGSLVHWEYNLNAVYEPYIAEALQETRTTLNSFIQIQGEDRDILYYLTGDIPYSNFDVIVPSPFLIILDVIADDESLLNITLHPIPFAMFNVIEPCFWHHELHALNETQTITKPAYPYWGRSCFRKISLLRPNTYLEILATTENMSLTQITIARGQDLSQRIEMVKSYDLAVIELRNLTAAEIQLRFNEQDQLNNLNLVINITMRNTYYMHE